MFRDRDLPLRLLGTLLPAALGHRLSDRLTPIVGGARHRHASAVAGAAAASVLGDATAGEAVRRRFVSALAADDLDACRAWACRGPFCGTTAIEGAGFVPVPGPAVFVSFHLSGGLAIFDALRRLGFAPTLLRAPPSPSAPRYQRVVDAARARYLARVLERPWIDTGAGARDALGHHLMAGGSVVALVDVPARALELRDRAPGTLLGRPVSLPCGLLRLALARALPVIPFDGRIEHGQRTVRFHPPAKADDVTALLDAVLRPLEAVLRERPWDWHSWLEIDELLGDAAGSRAAQA